MSIIFYFFDINWSFVDCLNIRLDIWVEWVNFWLSAGAGISGLSYTFLVTKSYAAIEFTINRASKEDNKRIFKVLESQKAEIESRFGSPLLWEIMNDAKMSRIKCQLDNVNFYVDDDIATIKTFFIQNLAPFYQAFNPAVQTLRVKK